MNFETDSQMLPDKLSLETEFTRHILSLFGSLYDSRATPFIGHIDESAHDFVSQTIRTEEEEEDNEDFERYPPLESMLCNFRLEELYTAEVKARKLLMDELASKEELIQEASKRQEDNQIALGERLPGHTPQGQSIESELIRKRKEAHEKGKAIAAKRKEKYFATLRQKIEDNAKEGYRQSKLIIAHLEKIKKAEQKQRHQFAEKKKNEMIKRREKQIQKREMELEKQETAKKALEGISYRMTIKDTYNLRAREIAQRREMDKMIQTRREAARKVNERNRNKTWSKTKSRTENSVLYF